MCKRSWGHLIPCDCVMVPTLSHPSSLFVVVRSWSGWRGAWVLLGISALLHAQDTEVFELEELSVVEGARRDPFDFEIETPRVEGEVLARNLTVAAALEEDPAVYLSRRGPQMLEPEVRGFSFDRISTHFNGLPLVTADAPRGQSPVNFFSSGMIESVAVETFFPSVTEGPLATGARLRMETFEDPFSGGGAPGWEGESRLLAGSNQPGWQGSVGAGNHTRSFATRLGGSAARLGDYKGANGREVDSDYQAWSMGTAARLRFSPHQTIEAVVYDFHQDLARTPSMPFDAKDSELWVGTARYQWRNGIDRWQLRTGYSESSLFRTSEDRPVQMGPSVRVEEHTGEALAATAGGSWERVWSSRWATTLGVDGLWQSRDAQRVRFLNDGGTIEDRIWPDVRARNLGLFAEGRWSPDASTRLRFGLRIDEDHRKARGADALVSGPPGAPPATIRERFVEFHGAEAGAETFRHQAGAAQLVIERNLSTHWVGRAGLGWTAAMPDAGQNFGAFSPSPGGGSLLGNPTLEPEEKHEIQTGLRYRDESWQFKIDLYYARIGNYITRRLIEPDSTVFSFYPLKAEVYGGEAGFVWTPREWLPGLSFSAAGGLVRRGSRTEGERLPPSPPWRTQFQLRYDDRFQETPVWLRVEADFVGARGDTDPALDPFAFASAGYGLWHLSLGVELIDGLSLEFSLTNLWNKLYYPYQEPPASPGGGGGPEPLPGPGRGLEVSARFRF